MPKHYNRYNQHRMTLNTAGFEPVVFNPIEFKPVEADYSILERAMAKQEERQKEANEKYNIIKQTVGKLRKTIHQDPETLARFDEIINNELKPIDNAVNVGDFSNVGLISQNAAGNILENAEIGGMQQRNEQFEKEDEIQRARRDRGDISQDTYEWWSKQNPYTNDNIIDANGKVIGAQKYEPTFRPENDLKWENVYALAKQMLSPEKGSIGSTTNYDKHGVISNTTVGSDYRYERIRPEDITATVGKIIGNNWKALKQDFEVKLYQLEKLKGEYESLPIGSQERALKEQQYNNMQLLTTGANGVQLTNDVNGWTTYYTRMVADGLYSEGLGYDWRFTENSKIGKLKTDSEGNLTGNQSGLPYPMRNVWTMQGGYNDMPTDLSSNIDAANKTGNAAINAVGTQTEK